MSTVEITRKNDDVIMGWVGRVSIAIWRNAPDDGVDWFRQEMARGKSVHGARIGHVPVLGPSTPPWSPKARSGMMEIVKAFEPELDCVVPIMTATGFMAATMRAMGAGMLMLLPRSRTQIKIVGSVDACAAELHTLMADHQPAWTPVVLQSAVTSMEREWGAA